MFDFAETRTFDGSPFEIIDASTLSELLASLTDDELAGLEDDLDFCSFAGVASERILKILNALIELDVGWINQLQTAVSPEIPVVY